MSDLPSRTIHLCLAHLSEEGWEQKYVNEAFETNWITPLGPNVSAFESSLKWFLESPPISRKESFAIHDDGCLAPVEDGREVLALCSGTAAIHLALLACGVRQGDEVLVQSFTFCASANPIVYLGAKPVFVGSESATWNIDPALLEKAIVDRVARTGNKPKAIIVVALYGMPFDASRILAVANRYGIPVIEDAAEGFGSRFDGKVLGTWGRYGIFSFNGNKMITTSGGGALVCCGKGEKDTMLWLATQARDAAPYYQHSAIGYNYRMSNVCAGIGRGQMMIADAHIAHHKHVQSLYEALLKDVKGFHVHKQPADSRYDSCYWLCTATIDADVTVIGQDEAYKNTVAAVASERQSVTEDHVPVSSGCRPNDNVEALRLFLLSRNIEVRPVWKPLHMQPVYDGSAVYTNGVEEAVFKVGFCLPTGPCVSDDDVRYVVDSIKEAVRH